MSKNPAVNLLTHCAENVFKILNVKADLRVTQVADYICLYTGPYRIKIKNRAVHTLEMSNEQCTHDAAVFRILKASVDNHEDVVRFIKWAKPNMRNQLKNVALTFPDPSEAQEE